MIAYLQKWREEISSLSKMRICRQIKSDFSMEKYLSLPSHLRSALAKFRLSCHSLAIETGCYIRPSLPPKKRLCQVCKVIEDEKLFLLQYYVTTFSLPELDSLILVATKNIPNLSHISLLTEGLRS